MSTTTRRIARAGRHERGAVIVLLVVAMAALLLAAALALDVGRAERNKTHLQNATDAAALAAAKSLDDTGSTLVANLAATSVFGANAVASGDRDLATAWASGSGSIHLAIEYSATLPPFTAGSPTGPFVRIIATGFTEPTWFARLGGINSTTVAARAVAGPSPRLQTVCDIAPLMVCGSVSAGAVNQWGFTLNGPAVLKQSAPGGRGNVGPGNFQLLRLGGSGAAVVRENLAGDYSGCATLGDTVSTQPGNLAGPTADGVNTRFGDYSGSMGGSAATYPPDVIVTGQIPTLTVVDSGTTQQIKSGGTTITASNIGTLYDYARYRADVGAARYTNPPPPNGNGRFNRRVVAIPIGDCTAAGSGATNLPVVGFACFFLLDKAQQKGNDDYLLGEFISGCASDGVPGTGSGTGPGPYRIQLYRDPDSGDS